ncbi:MAG: hypothetical protein M1830_010347 [Pleopsidium flavum]|nr:MAG: hypothetical protein M1830_010347 [Pleopsidium flavum]
MADNENVSANPEEPHFRLLDLPVEVRRIILRYFLVKGGLVEPRVQKRRIGFRAYACSLQRVEGLHAGVLRVNQQISREGLRILYGENTFAFGRLRLGVFEECAGECTSRTFASLVGSANAGLVRSVHSRPFRGVHMRDAEMKQYPTEATAAYNDTVVQEIKSTTKIFPFTRTLTIDFSECFVALDKTSSVILALFELPLEELQTLTIEGLADQELENFIKTRALRHLRELSEEAKEDFQDKSISDSTDVDSDEYEPPFCNALLKLTAILRSLDNASLDGVSISVDLLDNVTATLRRHPLMNDGSTLPPVNLILAQLEGARYSALQL